MPRVSVCIPTYNRRDYLQETLDSVFAQTYRDYEVVVVDDGSTDGTDEMLKQRGYDVRYVRQQNSGDAAARNRLIAEARGEFITFLDSDDLLLPDALERLIVPHEASEDDIVSYGAYLRIDEQSRVTGACQRTLHSGFVTPQLFQSIFVHSCGSMFPRRILAGGSGFDTTLRVCSDLDLWLRLSLAHRFVAMEGPTFKRRRHAQNLSTGSAANRKTQMSVLERFYYRNGGAEVIPRKAAMQKLSREACKAGRLALDEGAFDEALALLRKSYRMRRNVRTLWYIALAAREAQREQFAATSPAAAAFPQYR